MFPLRSEEGVKSTQPNQSLALRCCDTVDCNGAQSCFKLHVFRDSSRLLASLRIGERFAYQ